MPESTEAEEDEEDFETLEREVFAWLLSKPAVAAAVDLACGGRYDEAGPAFDLELKELLRQVDALPAACATAGKPGEGKSAAKPVGSSVPPAAGEPTAKRPLEADAPPAAAAASPTPAAAVEPGSCEPAAKRPCMADALPTATAASTAAATGDPSGCEPVAKRPCTADVPPVETAAAVPAGEAAAAAAARRADPPGEWLGKSRRLLEAEAERSAARAEGEAEANGGEEEGKAVPLYWMVDLPEVSKLVAKRGKLPPSHTPVERPHVTLLYLGGATDDAQAAALANLPLNQFRTTRAALEALSGKTVEVQLTEVVIEESVTCAKVTLPATVPCANAVPHVTLGTKTGVPARYANQVLEELRSGRKEGVTTVPLPSPRPLKGRVVLESGTVAARA